VTIYVYAFFLNFARTSVILLCPFLCVPLRLCGFVNVGCTFTAETPRRRGTQGIRTQQNQAGSGGIQKEAIASRHYNPNVEIVERWGD